MSQQLNLNNFFGGKPPPADTSSPNSKKKSPSKSSSSPNTRTNKSSKSTKKDTGVGPLVIEPTPPKNKTQNGNTQRKRKTIKDEDIDQDDDIGINENRNQSNNQTQKSSSSISSPNTNKSKANALKNNTPTTAAPSPAMYATAKYEMSADSFFGAAGKPDINAVKAKQREEEQQQQHSTRQQRDNDDASLKLAKQLQAEEENSRKRKTSSTSTSRDAIDLIESDDNGNDVEMNTRSSGKKRSASKISASASAAATKKAKTVDHAVKNNDVDDSMSDDEDEGFQPKNKKSTNAISKKPTGSASKSKSQPSTKSAETNTTTSSFPATATITTTSTSAASDHPPKPRGYPFDQPKEDIPPMRGIKAPPPQGNTGCLKDLIFVCTGVLDSLTREEVDDLIRRYGGKVTTNVSGRTDYLVHGTHGVWSERKLNDAKTKGTKLIDEDGLYELIRTLPPKSLTDVDPKAAAAASSKSGSKKLVSPPKGSALTVTQSAASLRNNNTAALPSSSTASSSSSQPIDVDEDTPVEDMLWVDKYKPTSGQEIIGANATIQKLTEFLTTWHDRFIVHKSQAGQRAVLISGPPGIGKSTLASVLARELGFVVHEFNASDTRNKAIIADVMGEVTTTRSINSMFGVRNNLLTLPSSSSSGGSGKKGKQGKQANKNTPVVPGSRGTVVIMDEVDGMSGSDRGGIQELLKFIKTTRVPIICLCNDASSPKIRTLKNYCLVIPIRRPTAQQIYPRIQAIAKVENLHVDQPTIEKIANSTKADIRQILNFLQMYRKKSSTLSYDDATKALLISGKDFDEGAFDVIKDIFQPPPPPIYPMNRNAGDKPKPRAWIDERQNYYFVDPMLVPLMVQEMYIQAQPLSSDIRSVNNIPAEVDVKRMEQVSEASDSIEISDLLNERIMSQQDYSLMPDHAVLSTVYPGVLMGGGMGGRPSFPSWLAKNSSRRKWERIAHELRIILSLDTTATYDSLMLEYLPELRKRLLYPLVDKKTSAEEAVAEVISFMDSYNLLPDDRNSILQLTDFADTKVKSEDIPKEVKALLTRTFNDKDRQHQQVKVSRGIIAAVRGRGGKGDGTAADEDEDDDIYVPGMPNEDESGGGTEGEEGEDEGDGLDLKKDKMIKQIAQPKGNAGKGGKAASPAIKAASLSSKASKAKAGKNTTSSKQPTKSKPKPKKKKPTPDDDYDSDDDY